MGLFDIIVIAIGLSMDAFAVGCSNGLVYKPNIKFTLLIALFYGFFQAIMPLLGYLAGSMFSNVVATYAPYIALILLGVIGGKMIYEAIKKDDDIVEDKKLTIKLLLVQAIATSIDALAVGVSFVSSDVAIYLSVLIIGIITFALSLVAVTIGKRFGNMFASKAELIGGIILIVIGLKIFIEGVFFA